VEGGLQETRGPLAVGRDQVNTRSRLCRQQRVLLAFLRRHSLFDQIAEDRLGVIGVDPDTARDLARLAARVRLQVGDHFAAAGSARGSFGATRVAIARIAASPSLPASPGAGFASATRILAFPARRSLQVAECPFELRLLLAERGDVFFDQSLGLIGLGHVVMVLSGTSEVRGDDPAYGAR
jgi:hypothetical protein